jgi:hypothetical protein
MSEIHYYKSVNGLGATSQLSPITYFPDEPEKVVRRFTRTKDGEPIFWVDYTIDDDTMYVLSLFAEPEYRDGKWVEYLNFDSPEMEEAFREGYEHFGKATKTVWLGYTETPRTVRALEAKKSLIKRGLMDEEEIMMQGHTLGYHKTKNELE